MGTPEQVEKAAQAVIDAYDEALEHRPVMWEGEPGEEGFERRQKQGSDIIKRFRLSVEELRAALAKGGEV